jgi:hypothetical protein
MNNLEEDYEALYSIESGISNDRDFESYKSNKIKKILLPLDNC